MQEQRDQSGLLGLKAWLPILFPQTMETITHMIRTTTGTGSRTSRMQVSLIAPILISLLSHVSALRADDWPQWQGPGRDGISREQGLLNAWPESGPSLAWRITGLGGGDSAPAVADGRLYGMSSRDGNEIVWCLEETNGQEIWSTAIGPAVEQQMRQSKEGPGGTPSVDGDHVFVIGMGGLVCCLERASGKKLWQRSLTEDFGGRVPRWSFRESPLVDGDRVLCTPGSNDATVVALDRNNGRTVWKSAALQDPEKPADPAPPGAGKLETESPQQPPARSRFGGGRFGRGGRGGRGGAAYSSVIAFEFAGQRQYAQFTAKTLLGINADNGAVLWKYDAPANGMGINCSTAIWHDGLVFASSAYGNGGGAVRLQRRDDGTFEAKEVYFSRNMQNHHGGMIVVDGALYGANGGNEGGFLTCIDFQTGEVIWRDRDAPKGALIMAGERLYLRAESGTVMLIEPSKEGLQIRGQFEQPDRSGSPAWAHPVVANGKLYLRDQDLLFCYEIAEK
jgi:outer membrane protein assembly factor BamB